MYVLPVIALPFLVVFLRNRKKWWALIPAYTLTAIALLVALETGRLIHEELVVAYVMFAIALPFFFAFVWNRRQWWALIPAAIMTIIGVAFLIAGGAGAWIIGIALLALGAWILLRGIRRGPRILSER